jgi:hypothetical protein
MESGGDSWPRSYPGRGTCRTRTSTPRSGGQYTNAGPDTQGHARLSVWTLRNGNRFPACGPRRTQDCRAGQRRAARIENAAAAAAKRARLSSAWATLTALAAKAKIRSVALTEPVTRRSVSDGKPGLEKATAKGDEVRRPETRTTPAARHPGQWPRQSAARPSGFRSSSRGKKRSLSIAATNGNSATMP